MDYDKLELLHNQLNNNYSNYISMIAVGSIAVGDPYIPNRSDKDILLVFNVDPIHYVEEIKNIIAPIGFDESYVFTPINTEFGDPNNFRYAFSNRFRSKTLFGRDLVLESVLPASEDIKKIYNRGLKEVFFRLNHCLVNSGNWSENMIRDNMWKQFKHAFMYLAIKEYYVKGKYPLTRKELVDNSNSMEISETLRILHSIDAQSKDSIIECAKNLSGYIVKFIE